MCKFRGLATFLTLSVLGNWGVLSAQDAEMQRQIDDAIDKGVKYLKAFQKANGSWEFGATQSDMTALVGWTLLESGVGPKDPAIAKAADFLRKQAISERKTYLTSLDLIFFDKLGDPADELLIEALGTRLLSGITRFGGWTYDTGRQDPKADKELQEAIKEYREKPPQKPDPDAPRKLHPFIAKQLESMKKGVLATSNSPGDNSNTQFAALALWVARRHGLPVDQHLALIEKRFRDSVRSEGGWGYLPFQQPAQHTPTGTMTCAGLLSFALAEGAKQEGKSTKELLADTDIKKGFEVLSSFVGKAPDPNGKEVMGPYYYFLFSLERVAVIYDLKSIGEADWYLWGARDLLRRQGRNGSWIAAHGNADTCFALLFLKKANVAADLSAGLKGIIANPKKEKPKIDPKDLFDLPTFIPKTDPKSEKLDKEKVPAPEKEFQRAALHGGLKEDFQTKLYFFEFSCCIGAIAPLRMSE